MDIRWFIASLWRITVFALYTFPRKYKTSRSSRSQAFYKKDVLKNLAKFTRKHLCLSLLYSCGIAATASESKMNYIEQSIKSHHINLNELNHVLKW